jgi:hypothetical protein
LQDWHYCATNKARAEFAYLGATDFTQRRELGNDYGHGYKSGFYDAATGKGCKAPAVPPPCYWSTSYQNCEGQLAIQDWYRGYECGVAAAQAKGYAAVHAVPTGPCAPVINETGCLGCSSPDYCNRGTCSAGTPSVGCMSTTTSNFHGGLFGQYGSEVGPPVMPHDYGSLDPHSAPVMSSPSDAAQLEKGESITPPKPE